MEEEPRLPPTAAGLGDVANDEHGRSLGSMMNQGGIGGGSVMGSTTVVGSQVLVAQGSTLGSALPLPEEGQSAQQTKMKSEQTLRKERLREQKKATLDKNRELLMKSNKIKKESNSKPRLTDEEKERIIALSDTMSGEDIALLLGIHSSTVRRHIRVTKGPKAMRRGRFLKYTDEMKLAAGRFTFLSPKPNFSQASTFLRMAYNEEVSRMTIKRSMLTPSGRGYRLGDFRMIDLKRNIPEAINARYEYHRTMPTKHGANTLLRGFYYRCLQFTWTDGKKNRTVSDWVALQNLQEGVCNDTDKLLTLVMVASPQYGVLHFDVFRGRSNEEHIGLFLETMMKKYLDRFGGQYTGPGHIKQALVVDTNRLPLKEQVLAALNQEPITKWFTIEEQPPHSPFLNILDEIFALVCLRMWQKYELQPLGEFHQDEEKMKASIVEACESITQDECLAVYRRIEKLLQSSKRKERITARELYDDSHLEHDYGGARRLDSPIELLLDTMIPWVDEEITEDERKLLSDKYGVTKLTQSVLEKYNSKGPTASKRKADQIVASAIKANLSTTTENEIQQVATDVDLHTGETHYRNLQETAPPPPPPPQHTINDPESNKRPRLVFNSTDISPPIPAPLPNHPRRSTRRPASSTVKASKPAHDDNDDDDSDDIVSAATRASIAATEAAIQAAKTGTH